jgi:hypothetical protein
MNHLFDSTDNLELNGNYYSNESESKLNEVSLLSRVVQEFEGLF